MYIYAHPMLNAFRTTTLFALIKQRQMVCRGLRVIVSRVLVVVFHPKYVLCVSVFVLRAGPELPDDGKIIIFQEKLVGNQYLSMLVLLSTLT